MGGKSTSTFTISNGTGIFNGTCAIVPSLKAPGFTKITTQSGWFHKNKFRDASSCLNGTLDLLVRGTASYKGFRAGFAAKDVPRTSMYGGGSFKAGFELKDTADWQVVQVPFNTFSYDWSGFTGRCDTKDPNGQQHHCCGTGEAAKYCPTEAFLATLTDIEVWAEGAEGDFHLEIKWIGASKGGGGGGGDKVCKSTEYCCPDAKHCLTPTKTSCLHDEDACASGDVCCPLTKICVTPGAACKSSCADQGTYCCPDALACLTPTNPGVFCDGDNAKCGANEVCCPLTKLCVKAGDKCSPP